MVRPSNYGASRVLRVIDNDAEFNTFFETVQNVIKRCRNESKTQKPLVFVPEFFHQK